MCLYVKLAIFVYKIICINIICRIMGLTLMINIILSRHFVVVVEVKTAETNHGKG